MRKLFSFTGFRTPNCAACSESLYRLRFHPSPPFTLGNVLWFFVRNIMTYLQRTEKIMTAADLQPMTDIKGHRTVSAGKGKAEIFREQYAKLVGRQYI